MRSETLELSSAPFQFSGLEMGARAGSSIGGSLGFFGNGRSTLCIGAYLSDPGSQPEAGTTYVFDRRSTPGDYMIDGADFRILGVETNGCSGFSLRGGGDVNNDGKNDLIVGAWGVDGGGRFDAGAAAVFFGGSASGDDLFTEADLLIYGQDPEDHLGWAVDISGDFNGDGIEDIVVGSPLGDGTQVSAGEVFVFLGGTHLTSGLVLNPSAANVYFRGEEAGAGSGQALGVGDVNNDGRADLLIGCPGEDWSGRFNAGAVYGFLGRTDWGPADLYRVENDFNLAIMGGFASDGFGSSVAIPGDLNNDGFNDIAVGAPYATEGGQAFRGRAYVFAGRTIGSPVTLDSRTQASTTLLGDSGGDLVGAAVGWAGDYDSNGRSDLVIGAPGDDPSGRDGAGSAYLFYGLATGFPPSGTISTVAAKQFIGAATGDEAGAAVGGIADFNGDGSTELVIGAPGAVAWEIDAAGRVYAWSGVPTVSVATPPGADERGAPYPNPARSAVTIPLPVTLLEAGQVLRITDPSGRLVRRIELTGFGRSARAIVWDGRNEHGLLVHPGVYFVDLGRVRAPRSIVVTR